MSSLLIKLKHEIVLAIPAMIFFTLAFNFIVLTEALMLGHGIDMPISYLSATLGGILVGKIILIVNSTPFVNAFQNKPLVYNVVWKIFLYGCGAFLFRMIEAFFHAYHTLKTHQEITIHFLKMLKSPIFWSIHLWLIVLFFIYVIVDEFINVIGKDKVLQIFFG